MNRLWQVKVILPSTNDSFVCLWGFGDTCWSYTCTACFHLWSTMSESHEFRCLDRKIVLRFWEKFNPSSVSCFLHFSVILSYTKWIISHLKIIIFSVMKLCVCLCAGFCLSSVFWSRPGWESLFSWTCSGSVTRARSSALTCGGVQLSVPKTNGNDWPTIRTPSRH